MFLTFSGEHVLAGAGVFRTARTVRTEPNFIYRVVLIITTPKRYLVFVRMVRLVRNTELWSGNHQ